MVGINTGLVASVASNFIHTEGLWQQKGPDELPLFSCSFLPHSHYIKPNVSSTVLKFGVKLLL